MKKAVAVLVLLAVVGCGRDKVSKSITVLDSQESTYFAKRAIVSLATGDRNWLLQNSREPALTKMGDSQEVRKILADLDLTLGTKVSLKTVGYRPSTASGTRLSFTADTLVRVFNTTKETVLGELILSCNCSDFSGTYKDCSLKDWEPRK